MKRIYVVGFFAMFISPFLAQDKGKNLVQNPSFEIEKGKLKKLNQINVAVEWNSPTSLRADLYSTEKKGVPCSAPENEYGKEYPMEGKNYAGIVMYSYNNKQPRTYIQNKLVEPLKKDQEYCVKFHVSLSDLSKYAVNNFGVFASKDPLDVDAKVDIIFDKDKDKEKVANDGKNSIQNARYNWAPVCANFKAKGKEEYIIIGNFFNNKDTRYDKMKKKDGFSGSQKPVAYYYIDQVEVVAMNDQLDCGCDQARTVLKEKVVYNKEYSSADVFEIDEQVKSATIYYDVNSAKIESNMESDLKILAGALQANPEYKIQITGHIDAKEGAVLRQNPEAEGMVDLDKRRAESVKTFFVEYGINAARIILKNKGDKSLASMGTTSLDDAKNRRVEFELIK